MLFRSQTYRGVNRVVGDFGVGNDVLTIDPRVTVLVDVKGGSGNDSMAAGGGATTLDGGDGDDHLENVVVKGAEKLHTEKRPEAAFLQQIKLAAF